VVLLISYGLTTSDLPQKCDILDAAIKVAATATERPSHCMWLVQTEEDVGTWGTRLGGLLSAEDRLIVVRIHSAASANGWLPPALWEWIKERVG
jgi:hypothetical protein